jgi:hypothetical protein
MRDVASGRPTTPIATPAKRVHPPAEAFHARLRPAKGGVLDLRETKPKAIAKPKPGAAAPAPKTKHVAVPAPNIHSQAKGQVDLPASTIPNSRHRQIQHQIEVAGQIKRSPAISRFGHGETTRSPTPPQPEPTLPHEVVAQHEHLSRLLELSSNAEPTHAKLKTKPTRANFAAGAVAVAIIGGYIWIHNYPHLAITTAADKAGFSASLPNYVPSSYNLNGPVSYAPGLVTLNFTSPSFTTPLKVTQQPTTWDSSSLLDNYVAQKTSSYSTVNGQGLTIYLFNSSQDAAWVNHGIWYTVEGTANLGRDQLLKMAYSF